MQQKQMAINRTKIPKKPEEEIGKEMELAGKDWHMSEDCTSNIELRKCTNFDSASILKSQEF